MGFGQLFFDINHFFDQLIFDTVKLSPKEVSPRTELWKIIKYYQSLYERKVNELKVKATKSEGSIMSFWGNALSPFSRKKKDIHPVHSESLIQVSWTKSIPGIN